MRILVAGGAGYIGTFLVPVLIERGYDMCREENAHCAKLNAQYSKMEKANSSKYPIEERRQFFSVFPVTLVFLTLIPSHFVIKGIRLALALGD